MNDQIQVTSSDKPFYGYKNAVLLAYIYIAAVGLITYGFSVIFPVMIKSLEWSRGDASLVLSFSGMLTGFVLVPMSAVAINKLGVQKSLIIGLVILLIGLFTLVTFMSELWQWYAIYGLFIPIGRALCGGLPMQVSIMTWFSRKRATVLGIVMTGAPFFGAIAQPLYTMAIQTTKKWQTGYLLSTLFCLIALVCSFWVKGKPSDVGQYPDGIAPDEAAAKDGAPKPNAARTHRATEVWTVKEVFMTKTIWIYIAVSMLQGLPFGLINVHGVLHLTDIGYTALQAANVLMMITFASGAARFPMGWLGDRIEPRWLITAALCLMLIGFLGFWKAPNFSILMVAGPIFGFGMGTILILMAAILPNYYGPETFASIRGFISPPRTIITANFPALSGYIADRFGSYNSLFMALSWCLVGGIFGSLFLSPPKKPQSAQQEPK